MKKGLPFLAILIFFLPIFYTLLQGITNATTDGWAHLFRQVEFDKALRDGQFPLSWAGEAVFGFGSPVFLFNWTLPYYFVESLLFLGIPLIIATHIFFGFSLLGGAIAIYLLLGSLGDLGPSRTLGVKVLRKAEKLGAFVGAILYLYAPYRLLNVFIYGAWGEILALFLGPLLLLWVIKLSKRQTRLMFLSGGILTALLILSHNVLSMMFIAMAGSLILSMLIGGYSKGRDRNELGRFGLLGVLGLTFGVLLTVFFWVPAVIDKNLIYASDLTGWSIRINNYKTLTSMLTIGWDNLIQKQPFYTSFTVGISILLIFILSLSLIILNMLKMVIQKPNFQFSIFNFHSNLRSQFSKREILFLWSVVCFLISLFLTLPISESVWSELPMLQLFLYPYRFIAGMTVSGAILGGYVFGKLDKLGLLRRLGIFGFLVVTILAGLPYLNPIIDHGKVDSAYFYADQPPYYPSGNWISMGNEDFLPKTVPREFLWKLQKEGKPKEMYNVQFTPRLSLDDTRDKRSGQANFKRISESKSSNKAEYKFIAEEDGVLTANIFYFPGWRVWDNGKEISSISYDQNGRITFPVSAGQHTILMKFTDTPIHTYSKIFSLFAFLGFLGLGVWGKRFRIFI